MVDNRTIDRQALTITKAIDRLSLKITSTSENSSISQYKSQDIDEIVSGNGVFYIGKIKIDGTYLIEKVEKVSATEEDYDIQFANISNNVTKLTYVDAWTNRLTLTYDKLEDISNV